MVDEHMTREVDDALVALLGVEEDPAHVGRGRAVARERLSTAMVRGRSRRRRRAWLLPAVATLTMIGGGAAIAQTTGLADRLLGNTQDEAATRIGSLEDAEAPGLTDAELEQVFDQGRMRQAVGDRLKGDDGVVGATIVDDRGGLRLSLVRTERKGVCMVLAGGGPGAWSPNSTACIGFPPGWPVNEGRSSPHAGTEVFYGVLADGVATVRFHVDGEIVEPVVAHGTYLYWPRTNVTPTAIDAVLDDGSVIRRDLTVEAAAFGEFVARMRMMNRCASGFRGTPAEFRRKRAACQKKHSVNAERFGPAKPKVVSGPTR